ncbi:hypothetical protein LZ32DRAFT_264061 [Colletotrichum eremochloae]|nr:hypothetical protein LZ32DRAFT_264061 [Colletotrichum eremochloae]
MYTTAHHRPHNLHSSVRLVVLLSEEPAYPNPDLPVLSSSLALCTAASDPRSVLLSALLILLAQFDSPVLSGSSSSGPSLVTRTNTSLSFRHQRFHQANIISLSSHLFNPSPHRFIQSRETACWSNPAAYCLGANQHYKRVTWVRECGRAGLP